jgi:hypothetical protein
LLLNELVEEATISPSETPMAGGFGCLARRPHRQLVVLLLFVTLAGVTAVSGVGTHPEAEVLPSSVELLPNGQPTHVLVVFRNAGETDLRDVQLSWINDEQVRISPAGPSHLASLAPHAETVWTMEFSQSGIDPVVGSVRLRIDYKEGSGAKIIVQSLAVKSREPILIGKYLDAKIETTLETLDTYHPGKVNLLLTNKLGRKIALNIRANGPDFICFPSNPNDCEPGDVPQSAGWMRNLVNMLRRAASPGMSVQPPAQSQRLGVEVEPYQTHVEIFEVRAKERVEPGKYLLSFEITLSPNDAQSAAQSMVKSQVVEVGVLAESTILKLLGVPSFLLMPGSLLILTVGLLSKFTPSWSRSEKGLEVLEPSSAHFWLMSITASGLMAVLFRVVFGWWYFIRYGLADVVFVWLASVTIGALVYAWLHWIERQRTPTEKDDPIAVLKRLRWQRERLVLDRYTIKEDKGGQSVFGIKKRREGDKTIWVCPAIKIRLSGLEDNLAERIRKQLGPDGNPGKLARLLKKTSQNASWSPKPIDSPRMLQIDQLTYTDRDTIVRE